MDSGTQQDLGAGAMIPRKLFRREVWSRRALIGIVTAFLVSVALSFAEGAVSDALTAGSKSHVLFMSRIWIINLRFLAEQVMYAASIIFIGAKFFEQRTLISVSIDRQDIGRMVAKGPDENNVVWLGRKYESRLEAETAASAVRSRLMQSSEASFGEFGW